MKFTVAGETYELVEQDQLTFAEGDAIERVTGLTLPEINRKASTCVCAHYSRNHRHEDPPDADSPPVTACLQCDCLEFESASPMRVNTACMWVSMKRQQPALTFAQAAEIEQGSIIFEPVADEARDPDGNPTDPPTGGSPTTGPGTSDG